MKWSNDKASIIITFLLVYVSCTMGFAQYPGGISTNIELWINAGTGVEEGVGDAAEDGDAVTRWLDQSGNGYHADVAGMHSQIFEEGTLNGNNEVVTNVNWYSGFTTTATTIGSVFSVMRLNTAGSAKWSYIFGNDISKGSRVDILTKQNNSLNYIRTVGGLTPTYSVNGLPDAYPATSLLDEAHILSSTDVEATLDNGFSIGTESQINQRTWRFGEVIVYDYDLSNDERYRVESYLAIKYGITLYHNYYNTAYDGTNAASTTLYDVTSYAHDIGGIGNELAAEGLNQTSSKSIENDAIVNISGTLDEGDYLLWGNDDASLDPTFSNLPAGNPAAVNSWTTRNWKAQIMNSPGIVQVDVPLADLGYTSGHHLVISDNSGFSNASYLSMTLNGDDMSVSLNFDSYDLDDDDMVYFGFAGDNGLLPIDLLSFDVLVKDNQVELKWSTVTEHNNDHFIVQRSNNNLDWEAVNKIQGSGNSEKVIVYSSVDENPLEGDSYYRIKQIDLNGKYEYSGVKLVKVDRPNEIDFEIFPNPLVNTVNIRVFHSDNPNLKCNIIDSMGRVVHSEELIADEELSIDVKHLDRGSYYLELKSPGQSTKKRIYKN